MGDLPLPHHVMLGFVTEITETGPLRIDNRRLFEVHNRSLNIVKRGCISCCNTLSLMFRCRRKLETDVLSLPIGMSRQGGPIGLACCQRILVFHTETWVRSGASLYCVRLKWDRCACTTSVMLFPVNLGHWLYAKIGTLTDDARNLAHEQVDGLLTCRLPSVVNNYPLQGYNNPKHSHCV